MTRDVTISNSMAVVHTFIRESPMLLSTLIICLGIPIICHKKKKTIKQCIRQFSYIIKYKNKYNTKKNEY